VPSSPARWAPYGSSRLAAAHDRSPRSATSGTRSSLGSPARAGSWRCGTRSCTIAAPSWRGASSCRSSPRSACRGLPGPNYDNTFTAVYTNRVPVTPVRWRRAPAGRLRDGADAGPRGRAARLDRVAIRARNVIQPSEFPTTSASSRAMVGTRGATTAATIPSACVGSSMRSAGTASRRSASGRTQRDAPSASASRSSWRTPGSARTRRRVRVDPGGRSGVLRVGQGQSRTTLAQIGGWALGADRAVTVVPGDTRVFRTASGHGEPRRRAPGTSAARGVNVERRRRARGETSGLGRDLR
jgi:CO/xanthine dehydrogenase Mo-binding subunit